MSKKELTDQNKGKNTQEEIVESPEKKEEIVKVEQKEQSQDRQYYVLPETNPSAQQPTQQVFQTFNMPPMYDPKVAKQMEKQYRNRHKSSGIAAWILALVALACGLFGGFLKASLFVDQASTVVLSIFGFGIVIYGLLLIAFIMHIISFVCAIVQLCKNRKAFSIITFILVPLINIAGVVVEIVLLFSRA